MACSGRGNGSPSPGASGGFRAGKAPGHRPGPRSRAIPAYLQRTSPAAPAHRRGWRVRGRGSLQGWKAVYGSTQPWKSTPRWYSTCFDRRLAGPWVDVFITSRTRGTCLRDIPDQCLRGRNAPCFGFWDWGHTGGKAPHPAWTEKLLPYYATPDRIASGTPPERDNPAYPYTLDLRRLPLS